jgi:hypothetical protein
MHPVPVVAVLLLVYSEGKPPLYPAK